MGVSEKMGYLTTCIPHYTAIVDQPVDLGEHWSCLDGYKRELARLSSKNG